jgi:hypothetical protein
MSMPNHEGRRTGIRGNPPTVGDLLLAVSAEKSRGFASKMSVNYRPRNNPESEVRHPRFPCESGTFSQILMGDFWVSHQLPTTLILAALEKLLLGSSSSRA